MKKFTLLIASLFITIGAMAQTATTYADGVYKIFWQYDQRGYLTYHADYPNDPQLAGVVNHNPNGHYQLTDEGIQLSWYLYTSATTSKSYLFEATTGKFITIDMNTASANGKRCALSEEVSEFAQFDLKATTNTTAYMLSYGSYNFCSGCGTNKGAGPVRFATDEQTDGGIPFVFVADGASITDEVKNAAIAKIEFYESHVLSKISDFQDVTTTFNTYEGTISNIVNGNTGDKWWSGEGQAVEKNITVVLNNVHQVETIKWYFCDNDKPHGATIERKAAADGEWISVADFTSNDIENNVFTCTADGNDVKELRLRITAEHNNWLQVAEVELYEFIDIDNIHEVIYNYVENDIVVGTMTYNVAEGSAYPDVVSGLYGVTVTGSKPDGNVTASGTHEIAVEIGEMPFEYYEDYAAVDEANGWYNLIMHSNWNTGNGTARYRTYLSHNESGSTLAWGTERSLTNPSDAHYWAFVGNPINGFRVVNKATGAEKVLSSNGTTNPQMTATEGMADGYNTTWQVANRKYDASTEGDFIREGAWFCLKYPGSNNYINANAANGNVAFWSDNDNGSGILAVKPLTINEEADIATFYTDNYVKMPSTLGAEVYYATEVVNSNYIHLEQITGEVIPAQTGVVIKYAVESNVVYAPEITSQGTTTAVTGNLLKGTTKRTLISKDANKSYYVLGMVDGVGFYNAVNGENKGEFYNGAFKAYLELPAAQGTAAFYGFDWNGTTGVEKVEIGNEKSEIYDLTGRRVEEITEPGIYIVGGKKVLVK